MKKVLSLCLVLLLLFSVSSLAIAAQPAETVLADNGTTDYVIVIAENASVVEVKAAQILADYLSRITQTAFLIVDDSTAATDKEIVVGVTNREADHPVDRSEMGEDGVRIFTDGAKIFLTGGEKRGALYAVYTFLEEYLGCRWFTQSIPLTPDAEDLTVVPQQTRLAVSAIDYSYVSPFVLRQTYWMFSTMNTDYSSVHKLHGLMAYLPEEYGGYTFENNINSVHTMQGMITADLFATHPEYFGADENGQRMVTRQPCFSNEDVLTIVINAAKAHFATANSIFSVSQNDNQDFCQCAECVAFNAAHGGVDSASLLNFVNKVAVAVREDYPDARVETLAYQRSEEPPTGLNVEENVVIRLCAMSTCVLHDLDDATCPENASFDANLTGWSALTDSIYIWDYSTNFQYIYAFFPNITSLQGRYQYFRDHNVVGVFDNGCGDNVVPGELHELRTYLICKLLWDPDTDIEKHIREFCEAYYGAAADDVIDFIYLFEDAVKGYKATAFSMCHVTCFDGGESLENHTSLTEADVRKLDRLVENAKSKELTGQQKKNLYGFELSWRFFKNCTWAGEFNWFRIGTDPEEAARELYYDMKDYGILYLAENWGVMFREEEPNFLVRPTFWYHTDDEKPSTVKMQEKIYPLINKILRVFSFIPSLFEKIS